MFKKITIEDKELYERYINKEDFFSCEYSLATLIMWQKSNKIKYDILDNTFILKKYSYNFGEYFMEPLGIIDDLKLERLILNLKSYREYKGNNWLFGDVSLNFLKRLKNLYKENLIYKEEENSFDYIYNFEDLKILNGSNFKKKRNKYNFFKKHYDYNIKLSREISLEEEAELFSYLRKWYILNKKEEGFFLEEVEGTFYLLKNLKKLNLDLFRLYVEGILIGFSIGERFNSKIYIIHVEKSLKEFKGSYAFINREFLLSLNYDIKYVNREEDLGILCLKKAKIEYRPVFFEKKYLIKIN